MELKYIFIGLLVLIILVGTILLIPDNPTGTVVKEKPLTIIHQTWVGDAPIHLAKELGFFEKYGVEVDIKFVEEPQVRRALLASKKADIALETIDMAVSDIGSGVDLRIFALLDASIGADGVVASKEIQELKDLIGKKVGAQKGEVPYFLLRYLMEKENIDKNEIAFIDLFPDDAGAAFLAGEIDAAGTWEPFLSKAKERPGGHVLVSSADAPGIIVDIMATRSDLIKTRRDDVNAVVKAWYDAVDFIKQNPEKSYAIMAEVFDLSTEEFNDYVSGLKWNTIGESKKYFGTINNKGQIYEVTRTIAEIAYEDGIINKQIDAEKIIDPTLLAEI